MDGPRHLARQHHVKADIPNIPGHQFAAVRNQHRSKAVERDSLGLGRHQGRRATVGEKKKTQKLRQIECFLKMQGTELEVQHQHVGGWLRPHDMTRHFEPVDRGRTSHEADHGAFD